MHCIRQFIPTTFMCRASLCLLAIPNILSAQTNGMLVFQSDFGLRDQAVSAMHGVALGVSPELIVEDLTHDIPPYNIWEASYRLDAVADFWPTGTVFVSVVDPGVGSERKSVVLKTDTGHYFVTPDNGTLTMVADRLGVAELREIDEQTNRLEGSAASHTFHGRDVYAYTGARLAAGVIDYAGVGPMLEAEVLSLPRQPARIQDQELIGGIPVLDPNYGNVWTNIPMAMLLDLAGAEDYEALYDQEFAVSISRADQSIADLVMSFERSFAGVPLGEPLMYVNSLENIAIALNQDDFAGTYDISAGGDWRLSISHLN